MKLDKETLIKQKFWVLLGAFTLLWLIGLCVMLFTLGKIIANHKANYDSALKATDGELKIKGGPKNPITFLPPWEEHGTLFRNHKNKIWKEAWEEKPVEQVKLYDWPEYKKSPLDQLMLEKEPKDPAELLKFRERLFEAREAFRKVLYESEIDGLREHVKELAPVELYAGSVNNKENFEKLFQPMEWKRTGSDDAPAPTREEMWIVQEDYWVKRDLLDVVKEVLDTSAKMKLVEQVRPGQKDPEGKLRENDLGRFRFRNDTWELDLIIEPGEGENRRDRIISGRSTLKNIHPGNRTLSLANPHNQAPLEFVIRQGELINERLRINGEDMAPNQAMPLAGQKKITNLTGNFKPEEPFTVHQVFDWYTSPVKRINGIHLAYQSARTAHVPLKSNDALPADPPDAVAGAAAAPSAAPAAGASKAPAGMGPAPGMIPGGMPSASAASAKEANKTLLYGLDKARYLQVTAQCRHLPFGMLVIVDQAHVPDMMAALANSRLRIQVTQVEIVHAHGIVPDVAAPVDSPELQPDLAGGPKQGVSDKVRQGPTRAGGGTEGRLDQPRARGTRMVAPRRPGFAGQIIGQQGSSVAASPTAEAAPEPEDPNVVELAIYGIATLYERFDDSAKGTAPAAAGSTPPAPKK
jgi:hypothetical protein